MLRRWTWLLWLVTAVGWAQTPRPVRHEPLPPAPAGHKPRVAQLLPGDTPQALAAAIRAGSSLIEQPKASLPGDRTPVYGPRKTPRVGMDRHTAADGKLRYNSVFDPEIVPFKRELAFDTVLPDVTMAISGSGEAELPPTPLQPLPGRELFWGHLRLKLPAGEAVPLPSVAPDARILQWQSVPAAPLHLLRDQAGNFRVRADTAAEVDLRFVMDAPSVYFAAALGDHAGHRDPEHPRLEAKLQARAERLLLPLGLGQRMDRKRQLLVLAEWFRSFQPGEPPAASGDPLADLVLGRKGVCRHRALGFVVMAHALGIPAHYVMNDAHAFVEVWAPLADGRDAWQRLDLGGGAESLDVLAADHKHLHVPDQRDPFPRPPEYGQDATDVRVDGQPVGSLAGAREVNGLQGMPGVSTGNDAHRSDARVSDAPNAHGATQRPELDLARRQWLRERAQQFAAPLEPPRAAQAHATNPGPGQEHGEQRTATRTFLRAEPVAWAGETLAVSGLVQARGAPTEHLPVEIWLIDPRQPLAGRLLGVAVTLADGSFTTRLAMPTDADLTAYDLVARFAGSSTLAPSDSAGN